jgi:hypothetical protein
VADDYSLTNKHLFVPKSISEYTITPSDNQKGIGNPHKVMVRLIIQNSGVKVIHRKH